MKCTPELNVYTICYKTGPESIPVTIHAYGQDAKSVKAKFETWLTDYYALSIDTANYSVWSLPWSKSTDFVSIGELADNGTMLYSFRRAL